jgi:hypothetical protein
MLPRIIIVAELFGEQHIGPFGGALPNGQPSTCGRTNCFHDQGYQHASSLLCDTQNHEFNSAGDFHSEFDYLLRLTSETFSGNPLYVKRHTCLPLLREHPQQSEFVRFLIMKSHIFLNLGLCKQS